jgi:hypothetical protein
MSKRNRGVLAGLALAAVVGLWSVHARDGRALARDLDPLGAEKAAGLTASVAAKAKTEVTVEASTWRVPPLVGAPSGKVSVRMVIEMSPENRFEQQYDYYYTRAGQHWHETTNATHQDAHCH